MLLYIWMCVMAQAFFPGGHTLAVLQAQAYEAHLRAELDAPAPASALFGAAFRRSPSRPANLPRNFSIVPSFIQPPFSHTPTNSAAVGTFTWTRSFQGSRKET